MVNNIHKQTAGEVIGIQDIVTWRNVKKIERREYREKDKEVKRSARRD